SPGDHCNRLQPVAPSASKLRRQSAQQAVVGVEMAEAISQANGATIDFFGNGGNYLPCCVLVNTKRTLISPQPFVAWQTKRRRGLRPSARVGVVRAHRGSMPA